MEKELRKRQNMLSEAGKGVVLFAVWGIAKVNLFFGLSTFLTVEEIYAAAAEVGISEKLFLGFILAIAAAILIWQLGARLYIGMSASAEGKGKTKGYRYLVLAVVLLVTDIQTAWQAFGEDVILAGEEISASFISGFCVELASVYVLLELLISGICVKRLRNKMKV